MPLLRALDLLVKQTRHVTLKNVLQEVRDQVADGNRLAESLRQHPTVFNELTVSMVRAGEEGSFLEESLQRIADFTDGTANTLAVSESLTDCYNWSNWMYGDTNNFTTSFGINTLMNECCNSRGGDWNRWWVARGFKSAHTHGVNTAFADGSVRFLQESIDLTVFQRLGTIQAGDVATVD